MHVQTAPSTVEVNKPSMSAGGQNVRTNMNEKPTIRAKRILPRVLPKPTTELQKAGLRYELRVVRALRSRGFDLEHNPWFEYQGTPRCPDIVVYELSKNRAIVIEVKLGSTRMALAKLKAIYCPMVALATGLKTKPLVITKSITHETFNDLYFNDTFYSAVESESPVYIWPGNGPIT